MIKTERPSVNYFKFHIMDKRLKWTSIILLAKTNGSKYDILVSKNKLAQLELIYQINFN